MKPDYLIPIIVPTYHKMEALLLPSIDLLEFTWPSHGKIFILSDDLKVNNFIDDRYKTYRFPSQYSWITILYEGIKAFKKDNPNTNCVYLILDDLLPLLEVEEKRLKKIEQAFIANNWNYLYFPHYDHNYCFKISYESENFCCTDKNYQYFSQIGAGLISIDYLITLCELGIKTGIHSPWQFEFLRPNSQHHISEYRWPTVRDGFSKSKFINREAIKLLSYNEGKALRDILVAKYKKEAFKRAMAYIYQKIKNIKFKTQLLVRSVNRIG